MTASSWAGIISAIATVIMAAGGLLGAVTLLVPILRQTREVHKIVNQQRTDMKRYNTMLRKALEAHGIQVPDDPSDYDEAAG